MSWMVTQLYRGVASRPTRGRRAAHLSMAGLQSGGEGSSLPREAHSVRTSPWIRTRRLQQQHQQQHQQQSVTF